MKILKNLVKKGEATIEVENLDDLWFLSQIIEIGDLIRGKTLRKIQVRGKEERAGAAVKKAVWIKLKVENVEFHKYSNILRVGGMIVEAPDDIPKAHHTFNFEEGTVATIIKEKWYNYQIERLKEASVSKESKTLICVFDREEAVFALIQQQGYKILAEIKGQVEKKAQKQETKNFYKEIIGMLKEYDERLKLQHIILASPSFWKEELLKELGKDELQRKLVMATCSSVNGGMNEVLKRAEVKEVLKQQRASKEAVIVEELLKEISKQGAVAYGFKETEQASESGAIATLLLTDGLIHEKRQKGTFEKLERIMKEADKANGEVFIINSENEAGKKMDALGGIGALLRYKMSW